MLKHSPNNKQNPSKGVKRKGKSHLKREADELQLMANNHLDKKHPHSDVNESGKDENEITPAQLKKNSNSTGLPDDLKTGIENISGYSMDDVNVHYNSDKPAQLQAHAYAQGNQIHVAPGQEKHLAHEAWHVVQQKQGRVKPTKQLMSDVSINDDQHLEKEADVMGEKALRQGQNLPLTDNDQLAQAKTIQRAEVVQRWSVHYRSPDGKAISAEDRLSYLPMDQIRAIANRDFRLGNDESARERMGVVFLQTDKKFEVQEIINLARQMVGLNEIGATEEAIKHLDRPLAEADEEEDDYVHVNPLSVPKMLYRYVSTADQKDALKNGITFNPIGGGIPTSTKSSIGIAIQSGAVNTSKLLTIDTSKIPNFKFQYVPTRSKLKEVKILCNVPATAIS